MERGKYIMNTFRKCSAFILVVLALFSLLLTSCADGGDKPEDTKGADNTTPAQTELPELEAVDYNGYEFKVLCRSSKEGYVYPYSEIIAVSDDVSLINQAVYRRNDQLVQKYNIKMVGVEVNDNKYYTSAQNDAMAGDCEYDAYLAPTRYAMRLANEGLLQDLQSVKQLQLDQDYYVQYLLSDTSIAGKNYFASGAFSISTYHAVGAMYFNKDMITDYSLENPYELVRSGKWTWEKMMEMGRVVTKDLDNNGVMNTGADIYGLSCFSWFYSPLFYSTGRTFVEKDDSDIPVLTLYQQDVVDIVSQISALINDTTVSWYDQSATAQVQYPAFDVFTAGRSLFVSDPLYCVVSKLSPSDINYGILPIPKYNEQQDEYYSATHDAHSTSICIPLNSKDLDMAGHIIEDMTRISKKVLLPEFYEKLIMIRNSRDVDSLDMLEIIFKNLRMDLGILLNSSGLTIDASIRNLVKNNSTAISSTFEANRAIYQSALDKIVGKFTG